MAKQEARTIRVAAVQMESENGRVEANLERAIRFVDQAAEKGAELIILPEFMPTGYVYTTAIWEGAETKQGPTPAPEPDVQPQKRQGGPRPHHHGSAPSRSARIEN